jgi:hypothetical protein
MTCSGEVDGQGGGPAEGSGAVAFSGECVDVLGDVGLLSQGQQIGSQGRREPSDLVVLC